MSRCGWLFQPYLGYFYAMIGMTAKPRIHHITTMTELYENSATMKGVNTMIRAIRLTPNDRGDFEVNLYVDKFPNVHREPIETKDDATFWYGEDEDGFVSFGVSYDRPTIGHKPGYMWSSRASVFNSHFDKTCIECTIYEFDKPNGLGCWGHFSIPTLLDNLTDEYEVGLYYNTTRCETTFRVYRYGEVPDVTSDGKCVDTFVGNIHSKLDWNDVFETTYNVEFTDAYGMPCGVIKDKLATYEDAVKFIKEQSEEPIKISPWTYRDGFDVYTIVPWVGYEEV